MDKDIIALHARQSLHEFLLEILFSEFFMGRSDPEGDFDAFKEDFILKIETPINKGEPSGLVHDQVVKMADNFLKKLESRLWDKMHPPA
jgi:hypothetical protein